MDPSGFDTGMGSFDTDETRVFARLAEANHPVPPSLLMYPSDVTLPQKPGRSFTDRVSIARRRQVVKMHSDIDLFLKVCWVKGV